MAKNTKRRNNKNRYSRRRVSRRRVSRSRVSRHRVSKKNNKRSRKIYKRKMMRGGSGDVILPNYISLEYLVAVAHLSLAIGIYPILSPRSPLNDLPEDILMNISKHLARIVQPYKVGNRVIMKDKVSYDDIDIRPGRGGERLKNVLITEIPEDREGTFKGIVFSSWDIGYRNYEFRLKDILGKIKGFAVGEGCMVKNGYVGIIVGAPGLGGGPFGDEPENGRYHVYIPVSQNRPPDYDTTGGYYKNIPEADIDYLQEYPDGSPDTHSAFQFFIPWEKDQLAVPHRDDDY